MPDYAKIYLHNCYEVGLASAATFSFSLHHFKDDSFFNRPFGIITASNPRNRPLSEQENRLRNEKLHNELNSRFEILEARGCHDGHREEGYLIFDISLSTVIELGRKYEQFAIFYNSTAQLIYMNCENEKVIVSIERKAQQSL